VVDETPLTLATHLSNRLECRVLLKREDLQPVFSFKLRGAYNKMAHLDPEVSWKGVVACSAGKSHKYSCICFVLTIYQETMPKE
jgi:threonine dehydratase